MFFTIFIFTYILNVFEQNIDFEFNWRLFIYLQITADHYDGFFSETWNQLVNTSRQHLNEQ